MRNIVILVILAVFGLAILAQRRPEDQKVAIAPTVPTQAASPRPVSEHNWMKRSLDTTKQVTHKVAEQRKEDGTR